LLWQPRLRQYRAEQLEFFAVLIASWRWHGGGLCRDIVESIVCDYCSALSCVNLARWMRSMWRRRRC
jgi:hypothetical protein